ncbi:MAG: hypothetical protein ACRETY_01135, partial [Steroidobacteraceae bacterium]
GASPSPRLWVPTRRPKSQCFLYIGSAPLPPVRATLPPMNYLYSLYDALVSIDVPSDKARAVVDAMERDMGATLATKQDLLLLKQELKQDTHLLKQDLLLLKQEMESGFALVTQKFDALRSDVSRDLAALELRMTVKLGSMMVVGVGVTIAALRVWT